MRLYYALAIFLLFDGCKGDAPGTSLTHDNPFVQMKLVTVEGTQDDEWEIWEDTVSNTRILCHHSGFAGAYGGRSTSCVVADNWIVYKGK